MMMKFNFGSGPLVLKGTSYEGYARISVELNDNYADIPMEVIVDVANRLYSTFNVSYVSLWKDDVRVCTIDKEEKEGE